MKKTLPIAGVLMAAVLTAVLLTTAVPTYADSSTTNTEIKNSQKATASGIKPNVQNCAQNNIDTKIATGDEGVDCHNQRDENSEQTATD
jgi:archaellin